MHIINILECHEKIFDSNQYNKQNINVNLLISMKLGTSQQVRSEEATSVFQPSC